MKPSLTLCIKDFGNIKEAEIDIAPMMLFIGHNNTGKSYVAMLWWGILDALQNFHVPEHKFETSKHFKLIKEWFYNQQSGILKIELELFDHFIAGFNEFLEENKHNLVKDIFNSYDVFIGEVKIKNVPFSNLPEIILQIDSNLQPPTISMLDLPDSSDSEEKITQLIITIREVSEKSLNNLISYIMKAIVIGCNTKRDYLRAFIKPLKYLPASRSGYILTYKPLTEKAHEIAWSLENRNTTFFTKPIVTFLQNLVTADFKKSLPHNDLCNYLEEAILEGKIIEIKQPTLNDYLFQPKGTNKLLPFRLASSLVGELAPLIIFLKSFSIYSLIMEEPEAHLHPQAQRILMRILAKLFNRNVQILLTTHSTTIFQQVNNLITLFNHPKQAEILEKFGYSKEELLNPDEVVAYQFEETPEGTKVSKLEKTETGFIAPTFSEGLYEFAKETRFLQEELDQDVD